MKRRGRSRSARSRLRKRVVDTYNETRSLAKTATAIELSPTRCWQILDRAGAIKNHPPVFTARCATEAIALYKTGLSCRAVVQVLAKKYSPVPSQQWVYTRVCEAGVVRNHVRANELRESHRRNKDFDAIRRAARLLAQEKLWSVRRIAEELGVSKKVVSRALPVEFRCNPSLAMLRRQWQAYLPDVEARRAKRDRVIQMRQAGSTYPQIIAATGASKSMVYLYLRDACLVTPSRRRRPMRRTKLGERALSMRSLDKWWKKKQEGVR